MSEHKPETELLDLLRDCPCVGSRWRHYRGKMYLVSGCSIDETTLQPRVHYRLPLDDDMAVPWSRPLLEWLGTVEVDGQQVPRFVEVVA